MPGKVWSRYSAKTKDGTVLKFRIEDMPEERLQDVIDLLLAHFVTEETVHRNSGISKNPEAVKELLTFYDYLLEEAPHHIVICVSDDGTEAENVVLGASLMVKSDRGEHIDEELEKRVKTKEMQTFLKIFFELGPMFDIFENYDLDTFYDDRGVVVLPKYRGLGIAQEFFRVRRLTCKEHNVPLTAGWMTSFGSQKAAERDGWEQVFEFSYEEFGKQIGVVFEDAPPTCKFMIARGE